MKEAIITIDWELLEDISYRTSLGKSLKNTLRKFNQEELFDEIDRMISYFTEIATEDILTTENRVKSLQSCKLKYEKYFPSTPVEKTFNDVLGLRLVIDDYDLVDRLVAPESARIVDMRNGKAEDDGYRAIHVYYQKDHWHYPIEIQFVTPNDRQFNEWLHVYVYKYLSDSSIGCRLRTLYDKGEVTTEEEFRKELNNVLLDRERLPKGRVSRC